MIAIVNFYIGFFKWHWRNITGADGVLEFIMMVFAFLVTSFLLLFFTAIALGIIFLITKGIFEGVQVRTGLLLPYMKRRKEAEALAEIDRQERQERRKLEAEKEGIDDALIRDFGAIIQKYDTVSYFVDERRLPKPKKEILQAIKRKLNRTPKSSDMHNALRGSVISLASFQSRIGFKPFPRSMVMLMKRDQVHLEDMEENTKEFEEAVEHYLEEWTGLEKRFSTLQKRFDKDVEHFMDEINTKPNKEP